VSIAPVDDVTAVMQAAADEQRPSHGHLEYSIAQPYTRLAGTLATLVPDAAERLQHSQYRPYNCTLMGCGSCI